MPLPLLIIPIVFGSGLWGLYKGSRAVSDSSKASKLNTEAHEVFRTASRKLKNQKRLTTNTLEELGTLKLNAWKNQIRRFVDVFGKIKNVEITGTISSQFALKGFVKDDLAEMQQISLHATEILGGGIAALSAGALAGFGAYGGATLLASASTGTAISTLSGVAATNATLAWFGGGALSAGGLGIAGGTAVLGGIVAGPALLIGGVILSAKAKQKLAAAHSNLAEASEAAEQMKNVTSTLKGIEKVTVEFSELIGELTPRVKKQIDGLAKLVQENGSDYTTYTLSQRKKVHLTLEFTYLLKQILETPLLSKNGAPKRGLAGMLESFRDTQTSLEGT